MHLSTTPSTPPNEDESSKDPMAHMSESEKDEIRRDVREQSQRAYSIGYSIIGGGMAAVLMLVLYSQSRRKSS
ncbi:hypothetical protein BC829DRAFT_443964 [Chytridium lagenaria]|nr:hypothetical protein BC829DRAFT_443964 [Chytridium lagenaria]